MDFTRFTERARRVVVLAEDEARASHNYAIGTPHLLLGLLQAEGGIASSVLLDEFVLAQKDVRPLIRQGDAHIDGAVPFEAVAKNVLELAVREALTLGCNYIGTEHILLSLVKNPGETQELLERRCGGRQFAETIRLEVVERLRGADNPKVPEETEFKAEALKLRDVVHDILTGFQRWRDHKVNDCSLDNEDEAFVRWVEASEASEYLND